MGSWEVSLSFLALRFLEDDRDSGNQLICVEDEVTDHRYKGLGS